MLELEKIIPKKIPVRQLRVAELIKSVVAESLVQRKIDAEVLLEHFITVSKVKVSPDLQNATVFITIFQSNNTKEILKQINSLAPKFRSIISKSIKLKTIPQIIFRYDDTLEHVEKINSLLDSIKED
ncbi:MAG: 30S ribosome-binding factor RbfA [Rickettsiales bacterium]|jgi:ribosome-binding factor A|nr:30S ribosome-binding factor RbfA [Rickettsiales bacterium]